jgi:hypothetical protein
MDEGNFVQGADLFHQAAQFWEETAPVASATSLVGYVACRWHLPSPDTRLLSQILAVARRARSEGGVRILQRERDLTLRIEGEVLGHAVDAELSDATLESVLAELRLDQR